MDTKKEVNPPYTVKNTGNTIRISFPVNINFFAGMVSGLATSIGFHPIDRALYLRSIDKVKEHFLSPKYWSKCSSGLRSSIYQRVVSNSAYFTMQAELNGKLKPWMLNEGYGIHSTQMAVGLCAGMVTGFFSNALYAVKYFTINHSPNGSPLQNVGKMWKRGGLRPFFNGIYPGITRDAIFGVFYETCNLLQDEYLLKAADSRVAEPNQSVRDANYLASRFFSATLATALSSPFNYARNVQFKTSPVKKQRLVADILCDAWKESNKAVKGSQTWLPRTKFFMQKFSIGGSVRAGAGMAVGQTLFNTLVPVIRRLDEEEKPEKINP